MLIVTRSKNERVKVGAAWITFLGGGQNGGEIRLGIDAPRSVPIVREELETKEVRNGDRPSGHGEAHGGRNSAGGLASRAVQSDRADG